MIAWARHRGIFFLFNVLFVALLIWLVTPLFDHRSANPSILGRYSPGYAAYLAAWCALAGVYLVTAIAADRTINRNLFFAAAGVLAAAEIAVRWRGLGGYYTAQADPLRSPAPFVHFTGEPHATFDGPPRMGGTEEERRITLNALGLRGDIPPMPKNEYRVIVLGGSTVFNGAPLAKSIPGYLQEFLQRTRPNTRVYNWGVTSFVSGQELALLTHFGSEYAPDLVVSYGGINDIIGPYVYDPRPGYPYDWLVYETGVRMARGGANLNTTIASSLLRSRLATSLFRDSLLTRLTSLDALRANAGFDTPAWRQQIATNYLGNLKKLCRVSEGLGAEFAAFLQPTVFTKHPLVGGEPVMLDRPATQSHVAELYKAMRAGRHTIGGDRSTCTLDDVSDVLDGVTEQVFWDFAHVTNEGNRRIAQRIYERLSTSRASLAAGSASVVDRN
jgi:hypothetical protein